MIPCRMTAVRRWSALAALTVGVVGCDGSGNARVTVPPGASMRRAADSLEAAFTGATPSDLRRIG